MKSMIIFIHGLGGEPAETWGNFPALIGADDSLREFEVGLFGFPTSLFSLPIIGRKHLKIQTLADALRTFIENRYPDRDNLILVCHSLGGLIARRFLVDQVKRKVPLRVKALLLYGVPHNGNALAEVATLIAWQHNQLRQLCRESDLVRDLDADWTTFALGGKVNVRYVVGGLDRVVSEQSARSSWGQTSVDVVADRGHRDLVKPRDAQDLPYLIFRRFALAQAPKQPAALLAKYATHLAEQPRQRAASTKGYRVVGFDLDGTLLRGIDFSWTVVWKHLKFPEAVYKGAMRDYRKGQTTYQEWCDVACSQFRTKNLRRSDFAGIVRDIRVTRNLQDTLRTLRSAGFVLALLSGGIDTFLEEKIPDAADLFDYICINRLSFEHPSGVISGVEATPFDFEGKTHALEAVCVRYGCSLREAVFVGEGFNDEHVVNKVGLSIAYPPGETAIEAASISIADDDLSKILEHIL